MLTHYTDIKDEKKCKNRWSGELGVPQGHRQHNYSIEHIRLPIEL